MFHHFIKELVLASHTLWFSLGWLRPCKKFNHGSGSCRTHCFCQKYIYFWALPPLSLLLELINDTSCLMSLDQTSWHLRGISSSEFSPRPLQEYSHTVCVSHESLASPPPQWDTNTYTQHKSRLSSQFWHREHKPTVQNSWIKSHEIWKWVMYQGSKNTLFILYPTTTTRRRYMY